MNDIDIYIKVATLPDDLKNQVGNFVDYLKSTTQHKMKEDFDEPLDDFKEYME